MQRSDERWQSFHSIGFMAEDRKLQGLKSLMIAIKVVRQGQSSTPADILVDSFNHIIQLNRLN